MVKDFSNKNLQRASFVNEDLSYASFANSDLRGADFSGADLTGANFTQVRAGIAPLTARLLIWAQASAIITVPTPPPILLPKRFVGELTLVRMK